MIQLISTRFLFYILLFCIISCKAQNRDTVFVTISPGAQSQTKIQNALNRKDGKVLEITIKKGQYSLSSNLVTSRSNTVVKMEKGSVLNFTTTNSGFAVMHDNFVLDGGNIKGNGQTAKDFYTGYGILLNGVQNCTIKNTTFDNIAGNNILFYPTSDGKGCSNNLIQNNLFMNPALDVKEINDFSAIMMGYSGKGYMHNSNRIEGNNIDGNDKLSIGIGLLGHGNDNIIINNKISNLRSYGVLIYELAVEGNTINNTIIQDNEIRNIGEVGKAKSPKGMGIYIMTANKTKIIGNKIYNTLRNSDETETLGAGSISVSLSPDVDVQNNIIDGTFMYGIVSDYSFGSQFLGNTISNTKKSGMYFINMNDVTISNNIFSNIGGVALRGYFENTSPQNIKDQIRIEKYKNIDTGANFKISGNKFNTDKEVLYFIGTPADAGRKYPGNKIKNISFENNEVLGNSKNIDELVLFNIEKKGSNKIKNNKIYNTKN